MLYIVSTPIGNLEDITYRAVRLLSSCDYILCEDTRHSATLLKHYSISKPLFSYHKFNEHQKLDQIIIDLQSGKNICLISDAGTPLVSDPGLQLVRACIKNELPFEGIPGPCAAISALLGSGFDSDKFQFIGFLPRKESELQSIFSDIASYDGISICYESPNRVLKSLELFINLSLSNEVAVARELTKKFECFYRGSAKQVRLKLLEQPIKGEITLIFSKAAEADFDWQNTSITEQVKQFQAKFKLSLMDAIKAVAKARGVSKRDIYAECHNLNSDL